MKRDIYLHGAAGREFGRHFSLDVHSPAEAVRALVTLRPGLREKIRAGWWRIVVGRPHVGNAVPAEMLNMNMGSQALHIVPATPPAGGSGSVFSIIAGGVLLVAAVVALYVPGGQAFAPYLASMGASLVLGGVAGLLTTAPTGVSPTEQARPDDRPSFLFAGITNTSQPGVPVPLVFGRHLVGSIVVSASIATEDIAP
jgi:predicted phage tail protein